MRLSHLALVVSLALTACHGGGNSGTDHPGIDAGTPPDSGGVELDGGVTPPGSDGIAEVIAATDDATIALPVHATVTYLKPAIAGATTDPAGFTIQGSKTGAAIFVAIDPATLAPPAQVGDVVSFTVTHKATVARQPRALAITSYARSATGADVDALTQDLSTAADVVSNIDHYDSQLVTITGALVGALSNGGVGFQRVAIDTVGLTGNTSYQLRMPVDAIDSIDMVQPCQFTVSRVPMGRFQAQAQIAAFRAADIQLRSCPAPTIVSATSTSATQLVLTFTRNIQPTSVAASGAQFTFDHGLTASHATVAGRTITLTTAAQAEAVAYMLSIATSVVDFAGSPVTPASAGFAGFGSGSTTGAALSIHTTLGIPGPLSTTAPSDYFASVKPLYVVSYNGTRLVPNWVSWELNSTYLGTSDRQNNYRPDDTFPATEPQAQLSDYSGSGFERGHMCPSADRTKTVADNGQTFYLTNMVPQSANNNEGPWADLEIYARQLVTQQGKELFVISGGAFGTAPRHAGNATVPDSTWKIIVVLDSPVSPSPAQVTTSTRVIAVVMPNNNVDIAKGDPWRNYRVTVHDIETLTGYNFLSDVDPSVQAVIEARVDNL